MKRDKRKSAPVKPMRRIGFARAIEAAVDGEAPTAARLWRFGLNTTDKGDLYFTASSAVAVMDSYAKRGNPLAWYYEHEDRIPLAQRGGCPMKGVCSSPSSDLAIRGNPKEPECWAEHIAWTDEAKRQIVTGERRQLSPIAAYDEETREIVEILNVSLCAEGATHHGTLLASKGSEVKVDELYEKLMQAIEAGDWEAAETLIQEMEAGDGGDAMAKMTKMARAAMKAGKMAKPPAPPPADDVATKRLAASRETSAALSRGDVDAFNRERQDMRDATRIALDAAKRSDRQTVQAALSRAREEGIAIDGIDEREHLFAASPEHTERFIGSLRRKAKAGILIASKDGAPVEGRPAKPADVTPGKRALTPGERTLYESFNRGKDPKFHITEEEYLTNSARHGFEKPAKVGVA